MDYTKKVLRLHIDHLFDIENVEKLLKILGYKFPKKIKDKTNLFRITCAYILKMPLSEIPQIKEKPSKKLPSVTKILRETG